MDLSTVVPMFAKTLHNVDKWIDKAAAHATAKKFEPDVYVNARLAPDQYSFGRQIQGACDQAKYAAAYLSGQKAPSHPDTEKTIPELRQRIATCLTYIESFKPADFAGADARRVSPPWLQGKWLSAGDWARELAIPNFYFHATTAYAILRHNGVDLGKTDYIGGLTTHDG
jgi:hypothetical protein